MDKNLRNTLRNAVTQCRRLLEDSVSQVLQGQFGIHPDGRVEDVSRMAHLSEEELLHRSQILVHLDHILASGLKARDAVSQLVREAAFTHLNRICAFKMMEARGIIREASSRGLQSQGFLFYLADHPGDEVLWSSGEQYSAYKHFLQWLCGTLSDEIGVLFALEDPATQLFPPQGVLENVLALINSVDLRGVWVEDETLGWVYQFFTPKELRDKSHKESRAPRNSYEMAFRNQFYTPSYVVQFLADNTLGRIWYEMRRGDTDLAEKCSYLLRRNNEVFLRPNELPPETKELPASQRPLLQPAYIAFRKKKDPRRIRIADPACGSAHFLLYSYGILETIYLEAYGDSEIGPEIQKDYPVFAEYKKAIPGLILRHNIYGIDIDPRATQIAALALWLRAHRSYQQLELSGSERPRISSSNIVCAEPMPGEEDLLEQFVDGLQPRLLGQLVRVVFNKMKLAGEAGSLLKIEDEISDAVAGAKALWQARSKYEQATLFPDLDARSGRQLDMFDVWSVTDDTFWNEAESSVVEALQEYASQATNGKAFHRRLFAGDAARGFAFIDASRKQYDVVLMNPPFGEASSPSKAYIQREYENSKGDVYASFVERWLGKLAHGGMLGSITSRTGFFGSSLQRWRTDVLLKGCKPTVFADLGEGVLDTAMVETAAYCLERGAGTDTVFLRLIQDDDKAAALSQNLAALRESRLQDNLFIVDTASFQQMPGSPFAYWVSDDIRQLFNKLPQFDDEERRRTVRVGLQTGDDLRFVRAWWEVSSSTRVSGTYDTTPVLFRQQTYEGKRWAQFAKGGLYSPYYADIHLVVNWEKDGEEMRNFAPAVIRNPGFYFRPGLTWPLRTHRLCLQELPSGTVISVRGSGMYADTDTLRSWLALGNTTAVDSIVKVALSWASRPQFDQGDLKTLPFPSLTRQQQDALSQAANSALNIRKASVAQLDEASLSATVPALLLAPGSTLVDRIAWCQDWLSKNQRRLAEIENEINSVALDAYELGRASVAADPSTVGSLDKDVSATDGDTGEPEAGSEEKELPETSILADPAKLVSKLVSHAVGCAFGRWDIRMALNPALIPTAPPPFAPLPTCAPGMLVDCSGMPAKPNTIASKEWLLARPDAITPPSPSDRRTDTVLEGSYPLRVTWEGVLVADPDHPDDIVRRSRDVIDLLWGEHAQEVEKEIYGYLRIGSLRDYLTSSSAFFADHIKSYSKSNRKAPIYWLLQTPKAGYALWIYYHRLGADTLFKALLNYIEPKLRREENQIGQLRQQRSEGGSGGREVKQLEKQIARQETLLSELQDFHDKLRKVADLRLIPDLNDGVLLNIAPLWELVPWAEAKKCWEELLAGKYEWSSIGKQLREKGLVE